MQNSFEYERAAISRDRGILNASIGAEIATPGWSLQAFAFLKGFAEQHQQFMAEDVVKAAAVDHLPAPPDGRAFGGVIQRAVREGLIRKVGYAPATTSNLSPKCVWQSLVFQGAP